MEPQVETRAVMVEVSDQGQKALDSLFQSGWTYIDGFPNGNRVLVIIEREDNLEVDNDY